MALAAFRWMMTAPNAPLVRAAFDAVPEAGEVVVAVAGCGVCHTDLGDFYDGVRTDHPLPLALGNWGCPPEGYPAALDLVLNGEVAIKPFVEMHPLDDINRVFAAVHHHEIKKRAVMVPPA